MVRFLDNYEQRFECSNLSFQLLDASVLLGDLGFKVSNTLVESGDFLAPFGLGLGLLFLDLLDGGRLELRLGLGNETTLEGNLDGGLVGSTEPLVSRQGRIGTGGIGEDIILEELGFTRDTEVDGLQSGLGGLDHADNLASSLGAHSHTQLRGVGLVVADIVDPRLGVVNLEVTDVTVTLTGKEQETSIVIIEGHQDTGRGMDVGLNDGGVELARVQDGVSTIRRARETNVEDGSTLTEPDAAGSLDTRVTRGLSGNVSSTRIDDTDLLVLGGGGDEATIVVPVDGLDDIGVTRDGGASLTLLNVPNLDGVVGRGSGDHIISSGVEVDGSDLSLVTNESLDRVNEVLLQTTFRDSPDTTVAILRNRGDEVVVESGESNIKNLSLVSSNKRDLTQLASLVVTEDGERTTTSSFPDRSNETVTGGDFVGVPGSSGDLDSIETVLSLFGSAENVS